MPFFSLFKKKPLTAEINPFKVDLHSHLLPGIDDGVRTIKDSIRLIKQFKVLGYSKLITTPHIINDFYPNNREIITEKLRIVQEAIKEENIDIQIEAAAEYYVDMNFLELLEESEPLTFNKHYVLFETSYIDRPIILEIVIAQLVKKGYIPVLAHPERYIYLHNNIELYKNLKAQGVLFQINAKSLFNSSSTIAKVAKELIELGLVDFIGSDAHRMRDINRLEAFLQSKLCIKMTKLNHIQNNLN